MMRLILSSILLLLFCYSTDAQSIKLLTEKPGVSIRGLSVVNDKIVWVSGSKGIVGKSIDGGNNWEWFTVKGFEQNDFRDIEAFDAKTSVIMAVASPAYILKTIDGGITWKTVFTDTTKDMFLDAMDFLPDGTGTVVGDPIGNKMYIATTKDFGSNWEKINRNDTLGKILAKGESMFASSGTNIKKLSSKKWAVVTGGLHSGLIINDRYINLPIVQGKQTTGANSLAVLQKGKNTKMIIVGGDFQNDTLKEKNCVLYDVQKNEISLPQTSPSGYRSCVEFITSSTLLTCGTSGVDVSNDGGYHWNPISKESYHVCKKAKNGNAVFLAGAKGKIAIFFPTN
jgi:hypothetical protein